MNLWFTAEKPLPSVNGHLHIDAKGVVWEWSQVYVHGGVWNTRTDYSFRKVREHTFYLRGCDTTTAKFESMVPGQIKNVWNQLYAKAFVEILFHGAIALRAAGLTWEQLSEWITKTAPSTDNIWTSNVTVRVFEVFEPGDSKVIAYNAMYSSARGGSAYNRKYGRVKAALSKYSETDIGFKGWYWSGSAITSPGRNCLEALFTLKALETENSDKVIWFPVSRKNLYQQPAVGSNVTIRDEGSRWAYNFANSTYVQVSAGTTFTVGTPKFLAMMDDPSSRAFLDMTNTRGSRVFSKHLQGVLVYPLTSGDLRAVFMKPYGVDTLGIGHRMDGDWQVIAEYVYASGEREISHNAITEFGPWDDWDECHTVKFHTGIGFPSLGAGGGANDPRVADYVQFYARHKPTGRRTQVFSRRLHVVKRKTNTTMCLVPELCDQTI